MGDNGEQMSLREAREQNISCGKLGPYLSEQKWGTFAEDYSESDDVWNYFAHGQARSPAYRRGKGGRKEEIL